MSFTYGKPPPKIEGMVSLKVDNLTYRTTPDDLRRVFEKYGDVGDVYIPRDRWTRESRGFAFVRFYDKRDAEDAMSSLDGRMLDGRELRVQTARYGRPASPQRRGGAGGGGGRRRSRSRDRRRSRSGERRSRRSRSGERRKRRSLSKSRSGSPSAARPKRDTSGTRDKRSRSKSPVERSRSRSPDDGGARKGSKSPSGSPRRSRSPPGNQSDKD